VSGTAHQAVGTVEQKTEGNPLAAGLIAFGTGVLISSLIPATKAEEQAAQRLVDQAKEHGQPVMDEAKAAGQQMGQDLKEQAGQAAQQVKASAQESADNVRSEGQSSAQHVKDDTQQRM
jgi:acetyl/propionyl-CoA carboxylase alpha subunit